MSPATHEVFKKLSELSLKDLSEADLMDRELCATIVVISVLCGSIVEGDVGNLAGITADYAERRIAITGLLRP